jgi:molybdopterin-binding protein
VALHEAPAGAGHDGAVLVSCLLPGSAVRLAAVVTSRAAARLELRQGMSVRLLFKAQAVRVLGSIERHSARPEPEKPRASSSRTTLP